MIVALLMSFGAVAGDASIDKPSPALIKDNTTQDFKISVTNPHPTENAHYIQLYVEGSPGLLDGWTGGASASDNLLNAAAVLENSEMWMKKAADNLLLGAENYESTASDFKSAGENLRFANGGASARLSLLGYDNSANLIDVAGESLFNIGKEIAKDSENRFYIQEQMAKVDNSLEWAAGDPGGSNENLSTLDVTAASYIENAADNLEDGKPDNIVLAGKQLENAGKELADNDSALADYMKAAGSSFVQVGNKLVDFDTYMTYYWGANTYAADYLKTAGSYVDNVDSLDPAGSYIENAADNLYDGFFENVALNLENAANILGNSLGGKELGYAAKHLTAVADNLDPRHTNWTTAGNEMKSAANEITNASNVMKATADGIGPASWRVLDSYTNTDKITLEAVTNENELAPGESETLSFIADVASIEDQDKDYTLQVRYYPQHVLGLTDWFAHDDLTLTVDGKPPELSAEVTQDNYPANLINSGSATLTVTASEKLSSFDSVNLQSKTGDNLLSLSMSDFSTDDNIMWTTEFDAGAWDDNSPITVQINSAVDRVGNENSGAPQSFVVDTQPPIFNDNGFMNPAGPYTGLLNEYFNKKTAADGTTYKYVDNGGLYVFDGNVVDNRMGMHVGGYENVVVTVEAGGMTYSPVWDMPTNENRFFVEGGIYVPLGYTMLTTGKVTATDLTGNSTSDNVENLFIDSEAPSVSFDTLAGESWSENLLINDASPTISMTISDSGLGVALENLHVQLDETDNTFGGGMATLDNSAPYVWDASAGQATFENMLSHLPDGSGDGGKQYWVNAVASDNLAHDGKENVAFSQSFRLDATAPTALAGSVLITDHLGKTLIGPGTNYSITAQETVTASGKVDEDGSTVGIYFLNEQGSYTLLKGDIQEDMDDSDNEWTTDLTFDEDGSYELYLEETDKAGNSSGKERIGTIVVDTTAPTIELVNGTGDLDGTTTNQESVDVSAIIEDDIFDYNELQVAVRADAYDRPQTDVWAEENRLELSVPLVEGSNTIDIVAKDGVGNTAKESITVKRTVTPWPMYAAILAVIAIILAAIAVLRRQTA